MGSEKDRIGFIIPTIYSTGWARNALPIFVRTARSENKSLYIFPGGRLNGPMEMEALRNPIYSLINNDNLDGLISWSSTLRYKEDEETFEQFHYNFAIPFVTLEIKIPGYSSVNFDSYTGMKKLIAHCIKVHGAKKIAFIRGQPLHPTHEARLKAYEDALHEAGIPHDRNGPLVTRPFVDEEGDAAAAQLFEDRKLIPGKDFDTLIGSNDHLIFKAINYFNSKGYYVPRDYHTAGFDDSLESRLTECPLSTVKSPYLEMSIESFRILDRIISCKRNNNQDSIIDDVLLPAEPLIRESCGCMDFYNMSADPLLKKIEIKKSDIASSQQNKIDALVKIISDYLKLSPSETRGIVTPLIHSWLKIPEPLPVTKCAGSPQADDNSIILSQSDLDVFFIHLEKNIKRFFKVYKDVDIFLKILKIISDSGLISPVLFKKLEPAILRTVLKIWQWSTEYAHYERENLNTVLNSLKCVLLETRDRISLISSLAQYLPKIGIKTAGMALYIDDKTSLWIGHFSPGGNCSAEGKSFSRKLLVPETIKHQFSNNIFIVQPLFIENQSLGYFINTVSSYDGVIYEDIRSTISYTLKSILQFEEVIKAQQSELESIEQSRAAQAASEAKSQFLAIMSHEIRTPMNAIMGITEIQLQNKALSYTIKEAFERIYNSGDLLLGIINNILDLSKIDSGKLELLSFQYDIASLIHDTVKLNLLRYENMPVEFKLTVSENIPLLLIGDELRIKQIMNNLLTNAFKYTQEGHIELKLSLEQQKNTSGVILVICVSDTGQGMTEEQVRKLGDKYSRFNMEANRNTEGAGLGMNITRDLIQMMNGEIAIESAPGRGSVFTVRLPQECANPNPIGRELAENLMKLNIKNTAKIRSAQITQEFMPYGKVLIVDDVETNLYVARGLMAPYGLFIETVLSGIEAIEKVTAGARYDIIFMDHMMPKMDGIEATKKIRKWEAEQIEQIVSASFAKDESMEFSEKTPKQSGFVRTPIVALTANALAGQAEIFMKNGFDDFISKPIDIRQLNSVLNKLIRDKQPPDILAEAERQKNILYTANAAGCNTAIKQDYAANFHAQLIEFFIRDAKKIISVLIGINKNKFQGNEDIATFIFNVHAIKSALANVGESGLSAKASELEQAGRDQNVSYILSSLSDFIESLQKIIIKYSLPEDTDTDTLEETDHAYLREKMQIILEACSSYDKKSAKEALNCIKHKKWQRSIRDQLSDITDHLLHSEFDEITAIIRNYLFS
ncbi:MAG: ATP-binding protein [Treponema sp.]|nr:ATP-binding protein [Treponema sp.]